MPGMLLVLAIFVGLARSAWREPHGSGYVTWVLSFTLIITCALNAPLRDAALGMLLLVLSAGALKGEHRIWTKSQNLRPENRLNPA